MSEGLLEQIYITFLHSSSVQNKDHEWEEQMKKEALHEDGFEKKAWNQKQKSRDTAISFSHLTLLNHVISGGYLPINNDW